MVVCYFYNCNLIFPKRISFNNVIIYKRNSKANGLLDENKHSYNPNSVKNIVSDLLLNFEVWDNLTPTFLTNNSLDRITPIADINICFSLVEEVKVKEEKLNK